jgi:signal peptidase I
MNSLELIYRTLLYTYPSSFRLRYGHEMRLAFRQQYSAIAKSGSHLARIRFVWRAASDWLESAGREWLGSAWGPVREWSTTILLYLFVTTTLVQAYVIPTGSMEGNLRVGDHMLVDKTSQYRDVKRGDIVAFKYPVDPHQTFVKRVIGLPGDHIRMLDKQVIRNGHALVEPYTQHVDPSIDPRRDTFSEIIVPPDSYFVMGDNRDNSLDSRYWGFVPRKNLVGTPLVVYWSYDAPTSDLDHWNVAHLVDVAEHFFTKTRWDRTLLIPHAQEAR